MDRKDKAPFARASTDLFADVAAIRSFVDAKNAAADALDIKSANLCIVAAKLKVIEETAPLCAIPAKLANTEDRIVAQTNAIDLISNAKPKNASAIIDGWSLTANNSIDSFICGSKTHTVGQFT